MPTPKIKSTAILIGYNSKGKCVYSDIIGLSEYYDVEHVWDNPKSVKRLKLSKVKGYLFNSEGILQEEYESLFDIDTGKYKTGHARFADGTTHDS